MADKILENNQVSIVGEIISDFQYSHEVYGEGFYMVEVAVSRLSNYILAPAAVACDIYLIRRSAHPRGAFFSLQESNFL